MKRIVKRLIAVMIMASMVILQACGGKCTLPAPAFNYEGDHLYAGNEAIFLEISTEVPNSVIYYNVSTKGSEFEIYTECIPIYETAEVTAYVKTDKDSSEKVSVSINYTECGCNIYSFVDELRDDDLLFEGETDMGDWDNVLMCGKDGYNGEDGYLMVCYEVKAENPQLQLNYVEGEEWKEVYNCISLATDMSFIVMEVSDELLKQAMGHMLAFQGQNVIINEVYFAAK